MGCRFVVEEEKPTVNRDRLLKYYTGLLNHVAGDLSDAQKAALGTYVRNMTESAAEERLEAVSEEEKGKQTDNSAFQEVDGQERENWQRSTGSNIRGARLCWMSWKCSRGSRN